MITLLESVDISPILSCYYKLEANIQWTDYGHKGRQTGLQYLLGDDPWTSAVGKSKGKEINFNILNPFFSDTVFESVINKYNLKRTRLMWVGPYACYSMHKDSTPRFHIPLITNPECYFVFKDGLVEHMALGNAYWANTTKDHTFINCSSESRLHLVGILS
jgi:hypothetical protein